MDVNLDTLKREILDDLESGGFAVFQGRSGGLEGLPVVPWDTDRYPNHRSFLDVAKKAGVKLLIFATREFDVADTEELLEQLEDCDLTREERRDYEARLRGLRAFNGVTCSIELGFDLNSRLYLYEVRPDWYEEYLDAEDEIAERLTEVDDIGGDETLGGYFSKN